jgi:hypothetical protein
MRLLLEVYPVVLPDIDPLATREGTGVVFKPEHLFFSGQVRRQLRGWLGWLMLTLGMGMMAVGQASAQYYLNTTSTHSRYPIALVEQFLTKVRTGENTDLERHKLASLSRQQLDLALTTDALKYAFWLNLYNGYAQVLLKAEASPNREVNRKVFRRKVVYVSGKVLSLDQIEHGMLRHSRVWWAKGYLRKWPVGHFERQYRVSKLDYRIHFALNCGATSCPPIAFYTPEQVDMQLNLATDHFVQTDSRLERDTLKVSKLYSWYSKDFGGAVGVRALVKAKTNLRVTPQTPIQYKAWNWRQKLGVWR